MGDVRSEADCLRNNDNVLAISGVEGDGDTGALSVDQVVELLTKAGMLSLVYTSPSHTEDHQRWRVLAPTSTELPPEKRDHLVGRLNGLLKGSLSGESFTLSQSYYYGSVNSNPSHRVELIDGAPIDTLDELDETWIGRPHTATGKKDKDGKPCSGPIDEAAVLEALLAGTNYHASMMSLLGKWAMASMPLMEARQRLIDAMQSIPEEKRDARWQIRFADIDRCVGDVYVREAKRKDKGDREGRADHADADAAGWPEPVDFFDDDRLTGTPELRRDHLPEALWPFVTDTAERMGADPAAVALAAIVACASVINEGWQLQPKVNDTTWTERARLWGAIVGPPSILKTPVIAACTKPVDKLDAQARHVHAERMRTHKAAHATWKRIGRDLGEPEPVAPKLDRYMVEATTVEALSEVLRDDEEARQNAPQGKVLVRQDELSEWLAGFDRYRASGTGGSDRGAYLRLYNGSRHYVDRIARGSFAVSSWSACIIGGIQPEPIQRIARDAADDGLLQRFCYVVPGAQKRGQDRAPDHAAGQR